MKDLIMNVAGSAYIVWKGPFRVGDRIEVKGVSGDVIDIELFEFAIMEIKGWVEAIKVQVELLIFPTVLSLMKQLLITVLGFLLFVMKFQFISRMKVIGKKPRKS